MYEIVLCYRHRDGVGSSAFRSYWDQERAALVRELLDDLGRPAYAQLQRASRFNPLYLSIRLSRSWPIAAFFSMLRGLKIPPFPPRHGGEDERWDVVETLTYPSRDVALAALSMPNGRSAIGRMWLDAVNRVRNGAAVAAEKLVVTRDETLGFPRAVTMFFLRPRPPRSGEEMLRYWSSSHRALVESLTTATGHRIYDQLHARDIDPAVPREVSEFGGHRTAPFSGVARLGYANQWALLRRFIDPRLYIANTRLVMDEVGFIDLGSSALVFGKEQRA